MQNTTNYNLNKPDGNDFAKIQALNENADIIDGKLKELEDNSGVVDGRITTHLSPNAVGAHKAKNIALDDVDGLFVATNVETGMKELFTSVSNGKQLIGTAITDVDDSLVVPTNPTHAQLADLIGSISTGKKWASGEVTTTTALMPFYTPGSSGTPVNYPYCEVTGLNFKPSTVIIVFTPSANTSNVRQILYSKNFSLVNSGYEIITSLNTSGSGASLFLLAGSAYVDEGGFRMPTIAVTTQASGVARFLAIE